MKASLKISIEQKRIQESFEEKEGEHQSHQFQANFMQGSEASSISRESSNLNLKPFVCPEWPNFGGLSLQTDK